MTGARRLFDEAVTEAELQSNVLELAARFRWLAFHPYDSRRSTAGWPDLVLVRGGPSPAQRQWLAALGAVTSVDAHLWRPSDWSAIEETLR